MHSSFIYKEGYPFEFYLSLLFHYLSYNSELQTEVEIISSNSSIRYRNYKLSGLTPPNFTIQPLMRAIKPKQILELTKFLLFEHKIILISDKSSDNAILIESLLMLISPL